jgi:hypothetical protein
MASKKSQTAERPAGPDSDLRRVSHRTLAARIAARKQEIGNPELPRNSGKRRTASKKALLEAIRAAGGKW